MAGSGQAQVLDVISEQCEQGQMARTRAHERERANRLTAAERFVDAAAVVCEASRALGVDGCAVMLHGEGGPPVLAVDNLPAITDEHRLYCVSRAHWDENPVFAALRQRIGVFDREDLGGVPFVDLARDHG